MKIAEEIIEDTLKEIFKGVNIDSRNQQDQIVYLATGQVRMLSLIARILINIQSEIKELRKD